VTSITVRMRATVSASLSFLPAFSPSAFAQSLQSVFLFLLTVVVLLPGSDLIYLWECMGPCYPLERKWVHAVWA